MTVTDTTKTTSYELTPPEERPAPPVLPQGAGPGVSLPEPLLVENVRWFCRVRIIVIAAFAAFGVAGCFPGLLGRFGLRAYVLWPLAAAAVLAAANLAYTAHARRLSAPDAAPGAHANLWAQIIVDLVILTAVVHFLGSLETYAPFTYLFHVVLACIFFSRRQSLAVTALACALYAGCVALEELGVIAPAGIYADATLREHIDATRGAAALGVAAAVTTWLIVWYLASRLSSMVRLRDRELAETNRRLIAASEERSRHMLTTTHQLKSPFAAIHANAQLLLDGYCGELPEEAVKVCERIAARCRRLAAEIQEMLQLANLSSSAQGALPTDRMDLAGVLEWCIDQVRPVAQVRDVALQTDLQPAAAVCVEDHLKMLFSNLVFNAVNYSHVGGSVRVACRGDDAGATVSVADDGIGIAPEKLPRIFDEHYRTKEAALHNNESSGLGLAIVRHVVDLHRIRLRVESRPGVGTSFVLRFPPVGDRIQTKARKETEDGVHHDRG